MGRKRWGAIACVLGLGAGSIAGAATAPVIPPGSTYVAMGSSYASGPGVAERAENSVASCSQSRENYARQLARMRGLKLIDRSCGGATTVDIVKGGQFGLPPQLDGLTADTRLVTVTIGGNDIRYMADLGLGVCRHRAGSCPAPPPGFALEAALAAAEGNMKTIAEEVRRRSPQARLVFVDYVTVLPPGAPCTAVALDPADAAELRARAERLERLTAEVARAERAELLKASELTRGHDACAADPWVEGAVSRGPGDWAPVSFHPKLAAMTAIAHALDQRLQEGR